MSMSTPVQARFEVTSWDEQPFDEDTDGAKLTEALVAKDYSGDIEGTSTTKWLMAYAPDSSAVFVGVERIAGTVAGRTGTLVLQHVGRFTDGVATADLSVVSGTDGLESASGTGEFTADPAGSVRLDLTTG
jgi:hypothetical protein